MLSAGYITKCEVPRLEPCASPAVLNWYAIYTRPSHEKRVAEKFALREIECYLPSYRTVRCWKNRSKVELELPLFPGYVFACFRWRDHVRVLEVPSVLSILGSGRQPLQQSEIESLRAGLSLHRAEPHPYLNIGERARIKTGPLMGFEFIVVRRNNGLRMILTLWQMTRSVAVEVEACDLEPIAPNSNNCAGPN